MELEGGGERKALLFTRRLNERAKRVNLALFFKYQGWRPFRMGASRTPPISVSRYSINSKARRVISSVLKAA